MTQKASLLRHLESGQSITQMEAFTQMGICRLSQRIIELEALGMVISHESVSVPTRTGKNATVTRYTLLKGIQAAA
tara:strand:- start:289 stop:516 length:228 start_codon:yes stop_codon:yes gene_type:complete